MTYYAVHYTYDSTSGALDAVRPAHRAYLASLVGQLLVASGPIVGSQPPAALLIMQGASPTEVEEALNADPFWEADLIVERRIEEWNPLIGVFADQ